MKSALAVASLLFLSGCSVAVAEDRALVHSENACSADDECGDGLCQDGACQAREGSLRSVLFEVIPPADARAIAGVRFLKRIDALDPRGGTQDLALDRVAQVSGYVLPQNPEDGTCTFASNSVPARVTFASTQAILGLSSGVYTAVTRAGNLVLGSAGETQGHVFELNVPPGNYDVYVQEPTEEPPAGAASPHACRVVPTLLRNRRIEAGKVIMPLSLGAPARLDVTVQPPVPSAQGLAGWSVDMLDPSSGKVISSKAVLSPPVEGRYKATLHYSAIGSDNSGRELVRLTPPENSDAPMVVLERSALELFTRGEALIDQIGELPAPVHFQGQVERRGTSDPVSASLLLIANEIDQLEPGTLASFRRTLQTSADGRFDVDLLPGEYLVQTTPAAASGAAATQTTLEIGRKEFQAGQVIEVKDLARLEGSVKTLNGQPVLGASIHAVATPASGLVRLLDAALGAQPFVPRASACSGSSQSCIPVTDENGYFSVEADPGLFDMSVRTPDDAGFAWFVKPRVPISEESYDLGAVTLPLPVVYRGKVTSEEAGRVPGALIRAYVYVDSDGNPQSVSAESDMVLKSVLQVAETRATDDGLFELRLPARLE